MQDLLGQDSGVRCGAGMVGIKSPHCCYRGQVPQRETQMGGAGGPPLGSPSPPGCTAHWALHPTPFGVAHVCGADDSIQDPLGGKRAQHCWVQGQVNWRSDWIRSWEREGAGWDPGASLLPPSFAGGANFKSLVRLPPAQPQPPCCSPSREAVGWAGWAWSGPGKASAPHLRTPGPCWRLPGGSEGGPDPERPMVSSFGPRKGTNMAQGLGAGSRHSPRGCLILGAPPAGEDAWETPWWLRRWPCVLGPQVLGQAFVRGLGAGSLQAGLSLGALCVHVCARVRACVHVCWGDGTDGSSEDPWATDMPTWTSFLQYHLVLSLCPLTPSSRGVTPGCPLAVCPGWIASVPPAAGVPARRCGRLSARPGKRSRVLVSLGSLD